MKISYIPLILAVGSTLFTPSASTMTEMFAELDGVAYCFHFDDDKSKMIDWDTAIDLADEAEVCGVKGILAMPKTKPEHDTIDDLRWTMPKGEANWLHGWLGAKQSFNENKKSQEHQEPGIQWKWLDGTHVMVPNGNSFNLWAGGEPNNWDEGNGANEDCLILFRGSTNEKFFNDRECEKPLEGYFAQYELPTFKMDDCDTGIPLSFDTTLGECTEDTEDAIMAACDLCSEAANLKECVGDELDEYSSSQIAKITTCCKKTGDRKRHLRGE